MEDNINSQPVEEQAVAEVVVKKVGDTVTASEIVRAMVESSANTNAKKPLSLTDARIALELFKEAIIQEVSKGHRVQLNGFVSFIPSYRAPRKGNNVITNEPMEIPEGVQITAKVGSLLRKALKNLGPEAIQEFKSLTKKNKTPPEQSGE